MRVITRCVRKANLSFRMQRHRLYWLEVCGCVRAGCFPPKSPKFDEGNMIAYQQLLRAFQLSSLNVTTLWLHGVEFTPSSVASA